MKNRSAITLILLSIGVFYTFTNVEYKKVRDLSALSGQYQDVLDNISDIINLRDNLLIAYEEFPQEDVSRINKALPDHVDTVRFALELDNIASRYGIAIKDVSIKESSNMESQPVLPEYALPYEKATVFFSFVSSYADLKRLLADMEKSLRIMEIQTLSFQVDETGIYEHEIAVEVYWLRQ